MSGGQAGRKAPDLFRAVAAALDDRRNGEHALHDDDVALDQVWHHIAVFVACEAPDHALPAAVRANAPRLRAAFLRDEAAPSQAQADVSAHLATLGWAHAFEHVTEEGLRLDMADAANFTAVEFDGPTHYLAAPSGATRPNGKTTFKRRLLEKLGWTVVQIPHSDWEDLDAPARDAYLAARLAEFARPKRPPLPGLSPPP